MTERKKIRIKKSVIRYATVSDIESDFYAGYGMQTAANDRMILFQQSGLSQAVSRRENGLQ